MLKEHQKRFPGYEAPSIWFIEETIRKYKRQTQSPKRNKDGITRYLGYPENLLKTLGPIQEGIDFIGRKYITGRSEPIHFLARYYLKPVGLYLVTRTENERSHSLLKLVGDDWNTFGHPDCTYLDNGNAMYGPVKAKRFIGRFLQWVLSKRVFPVFIPPRSPWANGPVEGSNSSMFGKKVWNRFTFQTVEEIDQILTRFNQANIERAQITYLKSRPHQPRSWHPRIYFVRFSKLESHKERYSTVEILNDQIRFSTSFANQYVLGDLDVEKELLSVMVERDSKPLIIHQQRFPVQFTKTS